eukprot:4535703-Pyramimonas_sp.AAC.1
MEVQGNIGGIIPLVLPYLGHVQNYIWASGLPSCADPQIPNLLFATSSYVLVRPPFEGADRACRICRGLDVACQCQC